ncbi:hypothetical protein ACFVTC_20945 [Streptomyces sp. NPDC057950]|uniref:hypothetical protein n=1 Tax=Streptomyces sp. NPDC057950 TaxID=3346288 RepID=UPI0036E62773
MAVGGVDVLPHAFQLPGFQEDGKCGMRSCHADDNRAFSVAQGKVDTERRGTP